MGHPTNISLYSESISLENLLSFQHAAALISGEIKLQDKAPPAVDIARLTERMARGEEDAYRQFYEAYFNRLLAYLLVVTGREQLAREALQTTLLRVARHARRFASEDAFWGWLTVLARSSIADECRRSSRYTSMLGRFFERILIEQQGQTLENLSRLKEFLDLALGSVPAEERELIERKYFEGQSVRRIAEETHSSEKAVESRLVRIRQKLRDMVLSRLKHEG